MLNKIKKGLCFVVIVFLIINENVFTYAKNIDISIDFVNKKYIIICLKNISKKHNAYYYPGFQLKKYSHKKWKNVNFLPNKGRFVLTKALKKNEKKRMKIRWKKYFGKNLSKGKYKIKLIKNKKFNIK